MDGDWVFSATTTCAILPEPNLDTVGNVVLRNRSAVRVSGPLMAEFRGISALVPKNVMDGDCHPLWFSLQPRLALFFQNQI